MTVMPFQHLFVNRDDRSKRVIAELERVVSRLEETVSDAKVALDELRAERSRGLDGRAGEPRKGD